MKIRQAQTNATYLFPDPGDLNQRITVQQRVDEPADNFGITQTFTVLFKTWAKVAQPGASAYQGSVQTETTVTHYFTIRYRSGITTDQEILYNGSRFRIHRVRDLNSKRRFLLIETEELGAAEITGDMYG